MSRPPIVSHARKASNCLLVSLITNKRMCVNFSGESRLLLLLLFCGCQRRYHIPVPTSRRVGTIPVYHATNAFQMRTPYAKAKSTVQPCYSWREEFFNAATDALTSLDSVLSSLDSLWPAAVSINEIDDWPPVAGSLPGTRMFLASCPALATRRLIFCSMIVNTARRSFTWVAQRSRSNAISASESGSGHTEDDERSQSNNLGDQSSRRSPRRP